MHGQSLRNWTWKELKVDYVGKAQHVNKANLSRAPR